MQNYGDEESIYDEWGYHSSINVNVDFLLPTGIYIPMDVPRNATIREVKKLLWQEAIHFPLFNILTNKESYTFVYVTSSGLSEEIVDEVRHLSEFDLNRELPVLKLVQSQGNIEEKRVIQEIHQLAGIKHENDLNVDSECISFRKEMRELAKKVAKERDSLHWKLLLERHFPPNLIPYLNDQTHYRREYGLVQLRYENTDVVCTIKVNPSWRSSELTKEAVHTFASKKLNFKLPTTNPDDYVLKAAGKEFIVGDHEICMYKCLRDDLVSKRDSNVTSGKAPPALSLMHVGLVRQLLPESSSASSLIQGDFPPPLPDKRKTVWSLWQTDETFNVRVLRAGNVNIGQERDKKLIVHLGLYHGLETLCPTSYTKEHSKESTGNEYTWDEDCYFDIQLTDLPPNAKLCMTICTINSNRIKKTKKQEGYHKLLLANTNPIAWVNMTVFDFNRYLKMGKYRLRCWLWPEYLDSNSLKPSGGVAVNPNKDEAPFLEIRLNEYDAQIRYPSHEEVLEEAARQASAQQKEFFPSASKAYLQQLAEIVRKDRFDDLFDSDRNLLWFLRLDCINLHPESLPKVVASVKWNSYKTVALAQAMLEAWPPLLPERAMELLDCQFANQRVRDFAVKCLRKLTDGEIRQYLMQLVQVLKFESYVDCSLVRFLLERAWKNRNIGHFLFWHLKAEINKATTNIRFSLILEAYLYGNIPHMKTLYKQQEALLKMKTLNERVKDPKIGQREVKSLARKALHETASQDSFAEALSDVDCPLDPKLSLQSLIVQSCKVMNSKMRPLWLEFRNAAHPDNQISVIYKNGDDLRQDMLTLQVIAIMDMLWKSEGLDLRMIPYGCLATGANSGMIEVVTHSKTIANIQKSRGGSMGAFQYQTLLEWIESQNQSKSKLEQAIENFTYSCAGYCVATYVLGVGDRHSDNIMVTETGQLFHIDFGHILGNYKSKFGIKRERVPFVLAHDFVHVINKGKTNEKKEFEVFRKLCDNAFCILRKKGYLFITLFALMLHSGLPELTSLDHLEYLRETLALHVSEKKALQQFHAKFNKALANAWSTSVNWFFHNAHRA